MPTVEENERQFEEMGFARVKMLVTTDGLPHGVRSDAIQWVAKREEQERLQGLQERDRERKERERDRQREITFESTTRRIAGNTLLAAWIAAIASIIAVIVAALAWLFPRT